jgi:hypothetical protein
MRRHLSLVAAALLVFQVSVLAVSPFGVCSSVTAQATVDDDECCKGMAPGQMCPLNHHRHAPKDDSRHNDPAAPALRCGCGSIDPALISLTFGLGVLPSPVSVDVILVSTPVPQSTVHALYRAGSLDPPPPRA